MPDLFFYRDPEEAEKEEKEKLEAQVRNLKVLLLQYDEP